MHATVIYGAGGLGREVMLLLRTLSAVDDRWIPLGFIDDTQSGEMLDAPILGGIDALAKLSTEKRISVVVAVGSSSALAAIPANIAAHQIDVDYPNIAHPDSTVDWTALDAGQGNIVCAGARLNNGGLGSFNVINMNTVLGHDCVLGDRNLISPSATLNGDVSIGTDVTIGAGATIMPRVSIGDRAMVAIGSVVGKDVAAGDTVAGNPARVVARAKP